MNYVEIHSAAIGPIPMGSALYTLIVFIILLLLMKRFVWGSVQKMMDARAQQINDDLDGAHRSNLEAQKMEDLAASNLQESQRQASQVLENARINAEQETQKANDLAQAHANAIARQARVDARQAKEDAINQAKDEIADLSLQIAGQIVNKELNAKTHQKLIDDFISDLEKQVK